MQAPHRLSARIVFLTLILFGSGGSALGQPVHAHVLTLTRQQIASAREAARDPALDPLQRETLRRLAFDLVAGARERSASSRAASAEDGTWRRIPSPSQRGNHAAIYDPVRDRMIVLGGEDWWASIDYDDVWALSPGGAPSWSLVEPEGTPPSALVGHTAIYDPVRDQILVFGGWGQSDVWALGLEGIPTWNRLSPAGTGPSWRYRHTAIYDPVRDRMIVFGGQSLQGSHNDVWALSLGEAPSWARLEPAGSPPTERSGHAAIYDPVRDRMVVFGGSGSDAWELSLGGIPTWTRLVPGGTPPANSYAGTAIYDALRDRMVVFGESGSDLWQLSLDGTPMWSRLSPAGTGPGWRHRHTALYDPLRDRMVVFGGEDFDGISLQDVWVFSLCGAPTWIESDPLGTPPSERHDHAAAYDPVRGRMLVHGGSSDGYGGVDDAVWALTPGRTSTWGRLATTDTSPGRIAGHAAIHDPVRDRMVMFGGRGYGGDLRHEVWTLGLEGTPTWTQLEPAGTLPGARHGHTAVYDPVRDRMVVFGGGGQQVLLNDVWALSLDGASTWTQLEPTGTLPGARHGHTAVYDPARDRIIVFGGSGGAHDSPVLNDVWALSLDGTPTWTELAPAGAPPSARFGHTAIHDPVRDRMVTFAGGYGLSDVWALTLGGNPTWIQLAPLGSAPRWRGQHTAIYDRTCDQMVVFGGGDLDLVSLNDVWTLSWDQPFPAPTDVPHIPERSALFRAQPHPIRPGGRITFDLAQGTSVQLRVYDLRGRLVESLMDGPMPAGHYEVPWSGSGMASGVYYLEMRTGASRLGQRLVVMR